MSRTTSNPHQNIVQLILPEDPQFEDALEESRQGLRLHASEIDNALLVFGRALDAALAEFQEAEKQPRR